MFNVQGEIDGYDCDGAGETLSAALLAYAADCRETAKSYEEQAALLVVEAKRAEAAAAAAEQEPA